MIDVKAFVAMSGTTIDHDSELDIDKQGDGKDAHVKLTEDDFIICDYTIPGFCFTTKRWYTLQVNLIQDIEFNSEAFGSLLLPEHQKKMIHSLVKVHTSNGTGFDDLIKGKGKGMVFLLHGVPGTGKTLTAGKHTNAPFQARLQFNFFSRGYSRLHKTTSLHCQLWRIGNQ